MYFSHERASPIPSPQHQINNNRDWLSTNTETDLFETQQFEESHNIFTKNIENERRREEEFFDEMRNNLVNESNVYNDDVYNDNNTNNNYINKVRTDNKSYMDLYKEEQYRQEKDEMQKHLQIVREKIRLKRLQQEKNDLNMMHKNNNDENPNNYVNESLLTNEVAKQQIVVLEHEHQQQQQEQNNFNDATSFEQMFPKREMNAKEELFNRKPGRWLNNTNNQEAVPLVQQRRRRQQQMATNDDFGGGLGDCMVQRHSNRRSISISEENVSNNNYQPRNRPRGRPRANISDFGGSLGDVMSSARTQRRSSTNNGAQIQQQIQHQEITRTNLQRQRQQEAIQNWGNGSLSDILVRPSPSRINNNNINNYNHQPQNSHNDSRQRHQQHDQTNDIWAGQSLGDLLPQRRSRNNVNTAAGGANNNSNISTPQIVDRRNTVNNNNNSENIWRGQSLGDVMQPSRSSRNNNSMNNSNHNNSTQPSRNRARRSNNSSSTSNIDPLDDLINLSANLISNSNHTNFTANSGDYMADDAMTYERLLALDDTVPNRRVQIAKKQRLNPLDLFKKLRTGFYRKKKSEAEPDECAICLDGFKHVSVHCSAKYWFNKYLTHYL
jgi:hypothetical protein